MKGLWCASCLCLKVRGLLVSLSCFPKCASRNFDFAVLFFFSFPGGTFSTRSMISSFLFMVSELCFEPCIMLCASLALYTTSFGPYPLYAPTIKLVSKASRIFHAASLRDYNCAHNSRIIMLNMLLRASCSYSPAQFAHVLPIKCVLPTNDKVWN